MSGPLLAVSDLRTVVSGDLPALRGVSFAVDPGETVALVGESGSGKSLTALSIAGLLSDGARVDGGSVRYAGRELLGLPEAGRRELRGAEIAMIYQDPMTALNPFMRVGTQVREALSAHGVRGGEVRRRTSEVLAEVGLPRPDSIARTYPHRLSGGQRQRVMIAIALACRPKLLIADEPTTALDVTIQRQVMTLVDDLRRIHGLAVVWITHDLGVVARVAHRVLVMYAGRIVESAATPELFSAPQHPYTSALIGAIPPVRGAQRPTLPQIGGAPPDLAALPGGCSFHPRCPQRVDSCVGEEPVLEPRGPLTAPGGHPPGEPGGAGDDSRRESGSSGDVRPSADHLAACWVPRDRWTPR